MGRDVGDEVLLLAWGAAENLPEAVGLDKVFIRDGDLLGNCSAGPLLVFLACLEGLEFHLAEC